MSDFSFVFPGQGSQSVSMIEDLIHTHNHIKETIDEASDIVSMDLLELILKGPKDQLDATENTQPALLAVSVALFRHWQSKTQRLPTVVAGHSLGEYSALVCAGVIKYKDAVRLVHHRGLLMSQAVPVGTGLMAAVLGLEDALVAKACREASNGQIVSPVNYNSPGQVVIAGEKDAVNKAITQCKSAGAKRAIALSVSVPSHCDLMRPAAEKLAIVLDKIEFKEPLIPVVNNVDVVAENNVDAIKSALVRQLYSPVRWSETIQYIEKLGADSIVECGPGKVLSGLNKRISRSIQSYSTTDESNFNQTLEALS